MNCPYCDASAPRMSLHSHLVEEHGDEVVRDGDATYRLRNPEGDDLTVSMDSGDEEAADRFSKEVTVLAFDRLLSRLEKR